MKKEGLFIGKWETAQKSNFHCKSSDKWGRWFRKIMRTFKQTGAEILECTVEECGDVRIRYNY